MKYANSFMRAYRAIMEEKVRQTEYMRKKELERILHQHNEILKRIEQKIKKT